MKLISKVLLGFASASLAALAVAQPGASKAGCVEDKVISAMQIRIAQTELMVAGLSCRQYDQWIQTANITRYNAFVTRYQPILMNDGHRVLKKFFPTEQRLNDYLTRLANEAQLRGNANMAIFCTQASKIYDDVLNNGAVQLAAYSASLPMASKHGHNACNPPAPPPVETPVAPVQPSAAAPQPDPQVQTAAVEMPAPAPQSIAAVIAQNDAAPSGGAAGAMQPVPDISMQPAVKNPPRPMLKPEGI